MPDTQANSTRVRYCVVRTGGWGGWIIRLATRSEFNHAFIEYDDASVPGVVVGKAYGTIEAEPHGLHNHLGRVATSAYPGAVCSDWIEGPQADKIFKWSMHKLGTPYGWLDILAIALYCISWVHTPNWAIRQLISSDTLICSQAVATAYSIGGIRLGNKLPALTTPGDLWDVVSDEPEPTNW